MGIVGTVAGEIMGIVDVARPLVRHAVGAAVGIAIHIPPIITGGNPMDIIAMDISVGVLRQRPCPAIFWKGG